MPALQQYVSGEMTESLQKLGYDCTVLPNPRAEYGPFLIARRVEDAAKPTVLTYGHGDVIRGQEDQWRQGLSPWKIVIEGEKMYGRGTADNKGQHTINIAALACVLEERGALGFNSTILIETGEETGSPGLADFCKANKAALKADALIGSDGPRLDHRRPTHLRRHARHAELQPEAHLCARAAIIRATGAGCWPIPASSWRMRWRPSPTSAARSKCRNGGPRR